MLNNFIYSKTKNLFTKELEAGNILNEAIVFIEDTKEIWNHGTYFDGNAINLKTINGKSILGEGDLITDIVVKSVEELNSLDVPIGTKARIFNEVPGTVYEGLNLGRILSGTETNPLPPDLYENFNKYTFDIEIDTNVSFPYDESALHVEVALPTHNSIYVYIDQNYTSISRIDIQAGFREDLYAPQNWYSHTHYLYSFSFEETSNMSEEQLETLFAISSAFNGSITVPAYVAVDDYVKTSEGWVSPLNNLNNLINNITLFIPTKTSQLENDSNFVSSDGLKTINGNSILGSGDIVINSSSSEETVIDDGVYAVTANEELIDYNEADNSCIGVALVAGEHKFMIAKSDATDGTNTTLYWGKNLQGKDVAGITETTDLSVAKADFGGKANTDAIIAAYSQHSVDMDSRDMCKVLSTYAEGGFTDWYIPAAGQLYEMYTKMSDINTALQNIGGTALESYYYWSSSENDASRVWGVRFSDGRVIYYDKYRLNRVRFVRDISIPKSLKERVSDLESKIKDLNTSSSGANVQAVDTGDIVEDVNVEYATTAYVDGLIGDINTILESIINGGFVNSIFPITLTIGDNGLTAVDLYNYVVQNHENIMYSFKENEIVEYNSSIIPYFYYNGGSTITYNLGNGKSLSINQSGLVMLAGGGGE